MLWKIRKNNWTSKSWNRNWKQKAVIKKWSCFRNWVRKKKKESNFKKSFKNWI